MEHQFAEFLNSEAGLDILTKLIQDKLSVTIEVKNGTDYYQKGVKIVVSTSFDDKEVCQSSDEFTF